MHVKEFMVKLQDALMDDHKNFNLETKLDEVESWDSVGRLAVAVMINTELGITLNVTNLRNCTSVGDIVDLVKEKLEG
ncbi:acyl carrier protein [Acetomicrobium sp.]|uniref:acyl carrier protein n=1 Tax=Acetomicrobium sp. TaxID=1872099 RepID=UPI0028720212|nr:acyl carrier protein [Acetomicrobium sp.]MDR9770441.1 acyl carrier protein [Acetomicrobium sp.]